MRFTTALAAWMFAILALGQPTFAEIYSVTDLGVLSGGTLSEGFGVNASGDVAGYTTVGGSRQAFRWQAGSMSMNPGAGLGTLGGAESLGNGIDVDGRVAGSAKLPSGAFHAFLWDGTMQDLDVLNTGTDIASEGNGIIKQPSGSVLVVGTSYSPSNVPNAFLNQLACCFPPQCIPQKCFRVSTDIVFNANKTQNSSKAYAVNDSGHVVGVWNSTDTGGTGGQDRAFYYRDFADYDITTLGGLGGSTSQARAINTGNDIVGGATMASSLQHAVKWSGASFPPSAPVDLDSARPTLQSLALGINDSGRVVGWMDVGGGTHHAFVSTGSGLTDLNTLLPPMSGWVLQEAQGVNNAGQVTGFGTIGGQTHAFLLSLCGNPGATVDPGEQCDQGAANGTSASCCNQYCRLQPLNTPCTPADPDPCKQDICSGAAPTCTHPPITGCSSNATKATVGGPSNACTGGTPVAGGCQLNITDPNAGSVAVTVPNGALPTATSITLAEILSGSCTMYDSLQGNNGRIGECFNLSPHGLQFSTGVTLVVSWLNCSDGCSLVSGPCNSPLSEGVTKVFLDGVPITDRCDLSKGCPGGGDITHPCLDPTICSGPAVCNPTTNTWTINGLKHFSEFVLGNGSCQDLVTPLSLRLAHLGVAGKSTVSFSGQLPDTAAPLLDPVTNGMQFVLNDGGSPILNAVLAPGAYDAATRVGWKVGGNGTKWTYINKSASPPDGVFKFAMSTKKNATTGQFSPVKVTAKAKHGNLTSPTAVSAEVVIPDTGDCFGTGPGALTCAPKGSGVGCQG
jgi:probable HAF family extracellular repeat protein